MINKIKIEYAVIAILVIAVGFQFFQIRGLSNEIKFVRSDFNTELSKTNSYLNIVGGVVQEIVNLINQNQPK